MVTYQVNISIKSGCSFAQEYTLTNSDLSPKDITGWKISGRLAKHPGALDATKSTSDVPSYKYAQFSCKVKDGKRGVYEIYMPHLVTKKLQEGKYVYNVVASDRNGNVSELVGGLAFVELAFGGHDDVIFDGGGADISGDSIILNGGTATGF